MACQQVFFIDMRFSLFNVEICEMKSCEGKSMPLYLNSGFSVDFMVSEKKFYVCNAFYMSDDYPRFDSFDEAVEFCKNEIDTLTQKWDKLNKYYHIKNSNIYKVAVVGVDTTSGHFPRWSLLGKKINAKDTEKNKGLQYITLNEEYDSGLIPEDSENILGKIQEAMELEQKSIECMKKSKEIFNELKVEEYPNIPKKEIVNNHNDNNWYLDIN